MKLLQQFNTLTAQKQPIAEDAAGGAVGAGAVAVCTMPLFATLVKQTSPAPVRVIKWTKGKAHNLKIKKGLGLKEAFAQLNEFGGDDSGAMAMNMDGSPAKQTSGSDTFDTASVIAKLKGLENKDKKDRRNLVSFGLEDDNGGLVRVSVSDEQAEDFEKALQAFLADQERDVDNVPEIAEVLFKLKDRFDIVDVQWPKVQEDEEEDVSVEGGEDGQDPDAAGVDLGGDDPAAAGGADAGLPGDAGSSDGQVKDLLVQVIDMMKADAEARKAEARAKEAEAKAKEADTIVKTTRSRVKQEEQLLDMDAHQKARKEQEKEAKRLAQLAKWKAEMGDDEGVFDDDDLGASDDADSLDTLDAPAAQQQQAPAAAPREEEERVMRRPAPIKAQPQKKPSSVVKGRVHPHDIASFILSRVK